MSRAFTCHDGDDFQERSLHIFSVVLVPMRDRKRFKRTHAITSLLYSIRATTGDIVQINFRRAGLVPGSCSMALMDAHRMRRTSLDYTFLSVIAAPPHRPMQRFLKDTHQMVWTPPSVCWALREMTVLKLD